MIKYPISDIEMNSDNFNQSEEVGVQNVNEKLFLEAEKRTKKIDNSKLLFKIHLDFEQYTSQEELFQGLKQWWIETKGRAEKTINTRIRCARFCKNHEIYPINWYKFDEEPEQVLNHLMYLINVEYKQKGQQTGNPTYGINQIHNIWKTIKTFAEAKGVNISWWGWNPPSKPENKVKQIPRPQIVNKLLHKRYYTSNRYKNALIKTLLTIGFCTGMRPEELIILQVKNIDFENCCIILTEQKKRYRNRQIRIETPIMYSHQQNSLRNWIDIWRPRVTDQQEGFLFLQENGQPFPSEDRLRNFLSKYCKKIWKPFAPKKMRDWNAIARLIRTKVKNGDWKIRDVTKALGHKRETTTEVYVEFAEIYYENDKYDWIRSVLKFHLTSKRMKKLMKQDYRSNPQISTNGQKTFIERLTTPVGVNAPDGVKQRFLQLEISTNHWKQTFSAFLNKIFLFSLPIVGVAS